MFEKKTEKTASRCYIRRADGWHLRSTFTFRKGTLILTEDKLAYDTHSVSTDQDIVILLKDVEKVKLTQKKLLFQSVGIYTKDQHYVFQVRNGQEWVDEIDAAVRAAKCAVSQQTNPSV